jgi:hypothetical protein
MRNLQPGILLLNKPRPARTGILLSEVPQYGTAQEVKSKGQGVAVD